MVAACKDVPTDKSPVTDVVGAVIAKVPSVPLEMDSPLPNVASLPVIVRSPVISASPLVVIAPPSAMVMATSPSVKSIVAVSTDPAV